MVIDLSTRGAEVHADDAARRYEATELRRIVSLAARTELGGADFGSDATRRFPTPLAGVHRHPTTSMRQAVVLAATRAPAFGGVSKGRSGEPRSWKKPVRAAAETMSRLSPGDT